MFFPTKQCVFAWLPTRVKGGWVWLESVTRTWGGCGGWSYSRITPELTPTQRHEHEKAPGGVHTFGEVRRAVRVVAMSVGKQPAIDILETHGRGVRTLSALDASCFDAVYDACELLHG
jgi:hypothetical protein